MEDLDIDTKINKSKSIKFSSKVKESKNGKIEEIPLKESHSKTIHDKSGKGQSLRKLSSIEEEQKCHRRTKSSLSVKELEIEKKLLLSIENSEKIDGDKIKLAEEINFKDTPDKIIETDEFGFLKDANAKKEDKESLLKYNARLEKWNYMLSNFDDFCKNNSAKLKKRVRKGIPDSIRAYAWQKIINLDEFYQKDVFQKLTDEAVDPNLETVIIKDIDRTFPKCTFFKEKYGGGQRQLYKVLVNYSKYNKEVGYVQGMGFIAALMLTYMDEERSFFMIHALMKKRELESLYLPGFPELNKKIYVLLNLQKRFIPKIYSVFRKFDVIPYSYASEWFLCLFSRNLRFNALVRIFDTFILEGYKVIYRFSLAFLKSKEQKLIECTGLDVLFKILKECFENVDIDELFKIAFGFHLSKKEIENLEKEYEKNKDNKKANEFMAQL